MLFTIVKDAAALKRKDPEPYLAAVRNADINSLAELEEAAAKKAPWLPYGFWLAVERLLRVHRRIFHPVLPPSDPRRIAELEELVGPEKTKSLDEVIQCRVNALDRQIDWKGLAAQLAYVVKLHQFGNPKPEQLPRDILSRIQAYVPNEALMLEDRVTRDSAAAVDCAVYTSLEKLSGVVEVKRGPGGQRLTRRTGQFFCKR